jgi:hypothetical protein
MNREWKKCRGADLCMKYVNTARSLGSEIAGKLERASGHTEAHGSWIEARKAPKKRVYSGDARIYGKVRIGGPHDVSRKNVVL